MNSRLRWGVGLLSLLVSCGAAQVLRAECCETAYRLVCQTIFEERQVTCYRHECETVYEAREVTRQVPVWETHARERRYKVLRPVQETSMREERYCVQRPVYNGPAIIHSTGFTDYTSRKRVELSDPAFFAAPARAAASTDTHIHSIAKRGGGLGSRLVSSMGWRRARQSEGRAEAIAADHAEDRIERTFNDEVNGELRESRNRYEEEYRRPLVRRGELPEHIRFSSSEDAVRLEVTQANDGQLAASGDPPAAPDGHDLTMRLHESAVNNYSAAFFAGATARQTEPDSDTEFDVNLPEWMEDVWKQRKTDADDTAAIDEPFEEWSLRFGDERPLSVQFADGNVKLTVRIARLRSGDETFTDWDVTGHYVPELKDGGVVLQRDGDLVMLPADFDGSLSPQQAGERRNLERELNKRSAQGRGFPQTIEFDALEPEGPLANAGPLEMKNFDSDGGWLTLAWDAGGDEGNRAAELPAPDAGIAAKR